MAANYTELKTTLDAWIAKEAEETAKLHAEIKAGNDMTNRLLEIIATGNAQDFQPEIDKIKAASQATSEKIVALESATSQFEVEGR